MNKNKTLYAFDLDETLFSHNPELLRVHVRDTRTGCLLKSLTNSQYNGYRLGEHECFDYSEFRSAAVFEQSATPILKMINHLQRLLEQGEGKVEILTARADLDDKEAFMAFLENHGIDCNRVHVRRAGNLGVKSTGEAKRIVLSELIARHGYTEIYLFDDACENLNAFLKIKEDFPKVSLKARLVKHTASGHAKCLAYN